LFSLLVNPAHSNTAYHSFAIGDSDNDWAKNFPRENVCTFTHKHDENRSVRKEI